jgi:hypothetical protein
MTNASVLSLISSYMFSASRIRYLRQQASVVRSMHALFRRVSERHVAIVVTEYTGSHRSIRRVSQFLYLIHVIQRWFCAYHLH